MITEAAQDPDAPGAGPLRALSDALHALAPLAQSEENLRDAADAELIDLLAGLRRLRAVTAAVEVRAQVAFDASQREAAIARGVPRREAGKGIADQIALARGISPHRASNDLALARGLAAELPETMRLLAAGATSEHAALNVARETICLMPEDRALVDQRIAARLIGMSPRTAANHTRAEAAKIDGESVTHRIRKAHADRRVTVRPAPDAMVYLTALLPVKDGVAAYAALQAYANAQKALGDDRSRGALMADELLARLTGTSTPDEIPVEVQLIMPAETLFDAGTSAGTPNAANTDTAAGSGAAARTAYGPNGVFWPNAHDSSTCPTTDDDAAQHASRAQDPTPAQDPPAGEPCAWIGDHPIPADIAREIALIANDNARRWIRRIFTDPRSGDITAADERRRLFTGATRRAILARDRTCRTCGAPIRHVDHIHPHAAGGATTTANGQGLCQRCNQTKTLPGWSARSRTFDGRHVTITQTPTGHRYTSTPPPPITEPPPRRAIPLEQRLATLNTHRAAHRRPRIDIIHPAAAG